MAAGAHDILLQAEHLLTGIPSSVPRSVPHKMKTNVRSNQPKDAQQGIHQVNIPTWDNHFAQLSFLFFLACKSLEIGVPNSFYFVPYKLVLKKSEISRQSCWYLIGIEFGYLFMQCENFFLTN